MPRRSRAFLRYCPKDLVPFLRHSRVKACSRELFKFRKLSFLDVVASAQAGELPLRLPLDRPPPLSEGWDMRLNLNLQPGQEIGQEALSHPPGLLLPMVIA